MLPLVEARGVTYRFADGTEALTGVDLSIYPGETLILLGPNGSGKTTFLLHLNGLLRGGGSIQVSGFTLSRETMPQIRSKVGLLFQDPDDQLFMPTVLEDVCFGPLNAGHPPADAERIAREALRRVSMTHVEKRSPHHLSFGEKRRVAIAGVLATNPELLAMDEPTTWLDPPGERELIELLRALPQAKVVVTHDIPFARAIGTRAVFFERGRVVAEGSVDDLVTRFSWRPS